MRTNPYPLQTPEPSPSADGAPRPSGVTDALAAARSAVLGVRAGVSAGTGTLVLASGLVVTSQQAVGHHPQAQLLVDGGKAVDSRVIWVDVGRNLALLFAEELSERAPVRLAPPQPPAVGSTLFALGHAPDQPFVVQRTSTLSLGRSEEGAPQLMLEGSLDDVRGGPLLDENGRLVAVVNHRPTQTGGARAGAIPVSAFERELLALDVPASQLADRSPSYRCPACGQSFSSGSDTCAGCGSVLPHARDRAPHRAGAERVVKDMLSTLGIVANEVRVGQKQWILVYPDAAHSAASERLQISLELDEAGRMVVVRAAVVRIPAAQQEPFFRMLLTLNDQTTGKYRLSLDEDIVHLCLVEPVETLVDRDAAGLFLQLFRLSGHYRRKLLEPFGVEPAFDLPVRRRA